ncbi:MAG TPA: electron transfer flavoprotein subunit alpha/FixB family protein [Trebonia sp.]|nr:electron transfer flavoprotein subunit alpha/FixB family protein [Trebonia sp.]
MTVFCLTEVEDGVVADVSLRALTLARGLPGALAAVVFASPPLVPPSVLADLAAHGVSDVYAVSGTGGYAPQAWARALADLASGASGPVVILAAGTDRGNEVLAHVGAITGLPMAANCVAVSAVDAAPGGDADSAACEIVRQRWAGLLLEEAVLEAPVALLTVGTDAVSARPAGEPGPAIVHPVTPSLAVGDLAVRAAETPAGAGGASLASARVVVGGGRGVGSADGFAPLDELASLLGGVVGVSRVVTSEGWRPHTQQVGQTGTKITPDVYLACGISGAIQHIAGCSGAKHIIAINTDPAAPILGRADYAIIGDLHEVIPALIKALRDRT